MSNAILVAAISTVLILFFRQLWLILKEAAGAKQAALRIHLEIDQPKAEMYTEARNVARAIGNVINYKNLCNAEDHLLYFLKTYKKVPGYQEAAKDLTEYLERTRKHVREADKARPFEIRYNSEE